MILLLLLFLSLATALMGAYLVWYGRGLAIGGGLVLIAALYGLATARKLYRQGYRIIPLGEQAWIPAAVVVLGLGLTWWAMYWLQNHR